MTSGLAPDVLQAFPSHFGDLSPKMGDQGAKFCYNRRTQAAEDPLVQQGRTIVFLPQVLLPRIFPQLSKRQSPRISYGPNVKKKGLLGSFLKSSTEKNMLVN